MPPPSSSKIKRVSITPTPGLVVKVRRTDGRGPAKVFLNVAYDAHVPRPPSVSPDTVKAALTGGPSGNYSVPLIVSDARNARDKVVDVVFSPDIGTWMKDADFQRFIIELSLQRVEERHNMKFDRDTLAFPNIRSKGPLEARDVLLPSTDGRAQGATPGARSRSRPNIRTIAHALAARCNGSRATAYGRVRTGTCSCRVSLGVHFGATGVCLRASGSEAECDVCGGSAGPRGRVYLELASLNGDLMEELKSFVELLERRHERIAFSRAK
ncbi:hypothetical protein EXIGLDRAFT_843946 [Exidia glandulosa HHB12029]|uniref:PIH1 N-terminal domain-containing protein n=1 Tax=Exidia glandulosa HHB12029 TaxID=1314781 RepID=A0A165CC39_EXIGL|nr:hypothetical protein EXIGLDRAFT_843946 [Exidia glandulosa HHB12029]